MTVVKHESNKKRCPECGKKANTFIKPPEHRTADFRIECEECGGVWYLQFRLKKIDL